MKNTETLLYERDIDLTDTSGLIALKELDTKRVSRTETERDIEKIVEISINEWIQALLYLNGGFQLKTQILKQLFLFGERSGINETSLFKWYPHRYGPDSDEIKRVLDELETKGIVKKEIGQTKKTGYVYERYSLKKDDEAKKVLGIIPKSIGDVLKKVVDELKNKKNNKELLEFIHSAYPEYAVESKN